MHDVNERWNGSLLFCRLSWFARCRHDANSTSSKRLSERSNRRDFGLEAGVVWCPEVPDRMCVSGALLQRRQQGILGLRLKKGITTPTS